MTVQSKSEFKPTDAIREAAAVVARRPTRALLTALGTVLGVGAFVATTGIGATARAQVSSRFDALKATEVRVQDAALNNENPFPSDTDQRLEALNGVRHAGLFYEVPSSSTTSPRSTIVRRSQAAETIPVIAATPGAIKATHPTLGMGMLFNDFHQSRSERVVVVGRVAAEQLGITRFDGQTFIFLGDTAYAVMGRLDDVDRDPELLLSVIIPESTAAKNFDTSTVEREVLIDADAGAAQLIGTQAPVALRPQDPARLRALVPPDPATLRNSIEGDVESLFLVLAIVAVIIGGVAIANATLVNVIERRSEIGLRRALGATKLHVAIQITIEAALTGAVAGVLGTTIGVLATSGASIARTWTATMDLRIVAVAPLIGVATGAVAGFGPSLRAARTPPAETLRQ